MSIGIVVPFYNGHVYTDRLVESVNAAAEDLTCTLFFVDNSPGDLPLAIGDRPNVRVEVIREQPGIGYGKACNRGFQLCKQKGFDHIMIVNQDGYLSPGILQKLLLPMEEDEDILLSAPLLKIYGDEGIEDFFVKYYLSQIPGIFSDLLAGSVKPYYEMKTVSGACFLFRLKARGYVFDYLFDPIFHMYYEDEDLCRRIGMVGGKMALVPAGADFYHQHSDTTDVDNRDRIKRDQLLSFKIYRIKDPAASVAKALSGILIDAYTGMWSKLLRGRLGELWDELWSLLVFLYQTPRILRSRKREMALSAKQN